jgi:hypothetical protein
MGLDLLPTDLDGNAVPCDAGIMEVSVSVSSEGPDGHFTELQPQTWIADCDDGRRGDLSLVVDNSGSEAGYLEWLQDGAHAMAEAVVDRGGRVSVVRVSTNATVLAPVTDYMFDVDVAIDGMYVTNGWTALYDGIRMGNETLGGAVLEDEEVDTYDDLDSFCFANRALGVVAFTDGQDNNSSDENQPSYDGDQYPGDGIDTTWDDLFNLRVDELTTPIYTIGLGYEPSHVELANLATQTGGRHLSINREEQLPHVFDVIGSYFDATHQVCLELPEQECGDYVIKVEWTWTSDEGKSVTGESLETMHMPCDIAVAGRVATILLTTKDPGIPEALAQALSVQTVEWVTPKLRPHVLVILDDNHHGEDQGDAEIVSWLLGDVDTLEVTYDQEPEDGLTVEDLDGYDVVWFSNPGYPMDDLQSFQTLEAFSADGGGVILQGDDMSWSWGHGFSMAPLTHLEHLNNGTTACGRRIDNNQGEQYRVTIADVEHDLIRGLQGEAFLYGNDIDHSAALGEGEIVLATAVPDGDPGCMAPVPVVVGYTP